MSKFTHKELEKRVGKGVRNIEVSKLFEAGNVYNMETSEEDPNGNLAPEYDHCWLTWQSKRHDFDEDRDFWSNEACSYKTVADAEAAATELREHETRE